MKLIMMIMMVLFASASFADDGLIETYKPNEVFDLSVHLSDSSGDVFGANCSAQVRLSNLTTKEDIQMNEIGGGWYNSTYNVSDVGKYFCRQNCTQSGLYVASTCDFIVGVKDDMLFSMTVLLPLFISFFLLVVSWLLDSEKHPALKIGLILLGFVFIFQAYQYSTLSISALYNTDEVVDNLADSTYIYSIVFWTIMGIFLITLVYDVFMLFGKKKHKTGDYEEDE